MDYFVFLQSHLFLVMPADLPSVKLLALIIIYNDFLCSIYPKYFTFFLDRMIKVGRMLIDAPAKFIQLLITNLLLFHFALYQCPKNILIFIILYFSYFELDY
jgi:hypothetical protein